MVTNLLTKALRELCAQAVKDFVLPTKEGQNPRVPRIVNGFLPPKRSGNGELDDFPFVLVRPEAGTGERESEEIRVNIIVGCYSEEFDGYEYGINVRYVRYQPKRWITAIKCVTLSSGIWCQNNRGRNGRLTWKLFGLSTVRRIRTIFEVKNGKYEKEICSGTEKKYTFNLRGD